MWQPTLVLLLSCWRCPEQHLGADRAEKLMLCVQGVSLQHQPQQCKLPEKTRNNASWVECGCLCFALLCCSTRRWCRATHLLSKASSHRQASGDTMPGIAVVHWQGGLPSVCPKWCWSCPDNSRGDKVLQWWQHGEVLRVWAVAKRVRKRLVLSSVGFKGFVQTPRKSVKDLCYCSRLWLQPQKLR